ncbi:MAG: glutamate--tRNA ligase [Gammaproteobacteria bacterium]|nr:glutamate--tRNA ligase [Gammaproteobacteria bacterium]
MSATVIRTRFAPSPTGFLHLGNVRTALFNFLAARLLGGEFILRSEDTDAERSRDEYLDALLTDLRWLGISWSAGPDADDSHGPYQQSLRGAAYAKHYALLEAAGHTYPCFCSATELAVARKAQLASGRPPRYPGTCRELSAEERAERAAAGRAATLRFKVSGEDSVRFQDLVRGPQRFELADIGDFVIRRSDGTPAFFFSNAVDDALMGITHVLRGEDHLSNTPRQIIMLAALELPIPRYGHISMVVADDGAPLSKRHGSTGLRELRSFGYLPLAICNHLARLGHVYDDPGFMSMNALADNFSLERLGRSPARHDTTQLRHWQKEALAHGDAEAFASWLLGSESPVGDELAALLPDGREQAFAELVRDNVEVAGDALHWAAQLCSSPMPVTSAALEVLRACEPRLIDAAIRQIDAHPDDFRALAVAVRADTGLAGKALFMPLRAALTGDTHGPEMARVYHFLGPGEVSARLAQARSLVGLSVS